MTKLLQLYLMAALLLQLGGPSPTCFALDNSNYQYEREKIPLPQSFQRHYFRLEYVRQNPLQKTAEFLSAGRPTILFGYHYNLSDEWLLGLSFTFRSFTRRDNGKDFALAAFGHETLRIIRIYRGAYFLVGPKFSYLQPTQEMKFPVQRDEDYVQELGVGGVATIAYVFNRNWFIALRSERWRGTATNRFHGLEHGFSVNLNLD